MYDICNYQHLADAKNARCIAYCSKFQRLYVGTRDGKLIALDRSSLQVINSTEINEPISCISILEESFKVMVGTSKGSLLTISPSAQIIQTIKEHSANICSIYQSYQDNQNITITSSWDSTAIFYKNHEIKYVLKGHSNAVWCSLYYPEDDLIITGSADRSIIIWKSGVLYKTLNEHSDAVRSLVIVDNDTFVSTSNDSFIIKWKKSGEMVRKVKAHSHFIYNLSFSSGNIVSCGEDGTIKILQSSDLSIKQSIPIHHQTCWQAIFVDSSSTIYALTSDSTILEFSNNPDNKSKLIYDEYNELLKQSEKMSDGINISEEELNNLPDISVLDKPGEIDGENKLVKDSYGTIKVYTWSANHREWVNCGKLKIPDSMSGTNQLGRSNVLDSKTYDYVFDVDLEGRQSLKLPYNNGDNPYESAQSFIDKNDLPITYLEQIVQFIEANTNYRNIEKQSKFFPCENFIAYRDNNLEKIVKKINSVAIEGCKDIDFAKASVSEENFIRVISVIESCSNDKKFPFIDWLRLKIDASSISSIDPIEILAEMCKGMLLSKDRNSVVDNINISLFLKCLANCINSNSKNLNNLLLLELFQTLINSGCLHNRSMLPLSSCILNLIIYLTQYDKEKIVTIFEPLADTIIRIIEVAMQCTHFDESVYTRLLIAYGSLIKSTSESYLVSLNSKVLNAYQSFISSTERKDCEKLKEIIEDFQNIIK
ncbi:MAG: WD repeat protein Lub1 [Marteilia pararefringens]